ncbi:MAG: nucleotidyltransferase domain-containing protein [Euryarchaeota archaeon]|nr:nucleotidyltransferase domain-containing protein [Euryarchaeota archaeon]
MKDVGNGMNPEKDFEIFKDDALGILLFGSRARLEDGGRSDIDICIVRPVNDRVLTEIERTFGGKCDIKVFENLPLYIQIEIIRDHRILQGDEIQLSEYFYRFRRLWGDMALRVEYNRFSSIGERMMLRKRWLHEKRTILGKI